jgi:hypothetical protein
MKFWSATLDRESPRYPILKEIFEDHEVPILSPVPLNAKLGDGSTALCYLVSHGDITLAIRKEDLTVTIDNQALLKFLEQSDEEETGSAETV